MKPTQVYHFIPEEETFEKRLIDRLQNCQEATLASAFFTNGALLSLKSALLTALDNGARITFLLGRFDFVTEPRAVRGLLKLSGEYPDQLGVFEVYLHAHDLLEERMKSADPADQHIAAYERKFARAKKYRQQRHRWERSGTKIWTRKSSDRRLAPEPEEDLFTFCRIEEYEHHEKLKRNIRKAHGRAQKVGESFPYQWVHIPKLEAKLYQKHMDFVVRDDLGRSFGFVTCTAKFRVLDSNDSEEPVVFYRFRRGWRVHFDTKEEYDQELEMLGFGSNRTVIKATLSRRLKDYFRARATNS